MVTKHYQASSAIKLRFPSSYTKNHWAVEEQTQKTTYAVPVLAAVMIVCCAKPIRKSELFDVIFSKIKATPESLDKILKELVKRKIIFSVANSPNIHDYVNRWRRANWSKAADYHFFTWDAPFLEYTKEGRGREVDRKRMVSFQAQQPDIYRCKKYDQEGESIPLPSAKILTNHEIGSLSFEDRIKYLLRCTFGKIGEKPCHWTELPLIRRTSPSGGSRHPSEGYFAPSSNINFQDGLYHVQADPCLLRRISICISKSVFTATLGNQSSSDYLGTIFVSSVFERNMYRYREPRTFRTIHMDVGHIMASIELLSKSLGIAATSHLRFDESKILEMIGASKFEEGIMGLITLKKEEPK